MYDHSSQQVSNDGSLVQNDGFLTLKEHEWAYFKQQSFYITMNEALTVLEDLKNGSDFLLNTVEDFMGKYEIHVGPFDGKMRMYDNKAQYRVVNNVRRFIMQQCLSGLDNYELNDQDGTINNSNWDFTPFLPKRQLPVIHNTY